jgi:hypothetical protein
MSDDLGTSLNPVKARRTNCMTTWFAEVTKSSGRLTNLGIPPNLLKGVN